MSPSAVNERETMIQVELMEISYDIAQVIEFLSMGTIDRNYAETEVITYLEDLNKKIKNLCNLKK